MKIRMYIFLNSSLDMSEGKAAAQVGHAAVGAFKLSDKKILKNWDTTKIILDGGDDQQMFNLERWFADRGIKTKLVIDNFLNSDVFTNMTWNQKVHPTALGVEVLDADEIPFMYAFDKYEGQAKKEEKKRGWFK